jgi:3-oxoacyl-[acyl-carrier-protein] synthase III
MKAKPETMIVSVDKRGYIVPASIVQALRRRFATQRVRQQGMSMDEILRILEGK